MESIVFDMEMQNFIVADTVGSEIVFSTTCLENQYKSADGSQTMLQITLLAPDKQQLMALAETYEATQAVQIADGALEVVKGFLKIGMIFTPPPASLVMAGFAGVASLIQAGLSFLPGQPDPVEEKLKELTGKLDELEEMTKNRFDDMKSFITQNRFAVEIISESSTLKKLMTDCLIYHTPESMRNFQDAYNQNSPLNMAYILMCLLSQKSTNPLIMEMSKDKIKKYTIFKKWEDIILGLLGDLSVIEAFACGLFKGKTQYDWDRLMDTHVEMSNVLKQWRNQYEKDQDEDYWKEIRGYLEKTIGECTLENKSQKANEIKQKCQSYLTSDAFCVVVFDNGTWNEWYAPHCPKSDDQLISSYNHDIVVYIYRSRQANYIHISDYDKLQNSMVQCQRERAFYYNKTLENAIQESLVNRGHIRGDGYVFLAEKDAKPEIRYIDSSRYEKPAGCDGEIVLEKTGKISTMKLIVVLP